MRENVYSKCLFIGKKFKRQKWKVNMLEFRAVTDSPGYKLSKQAPTGLSFEPGFKSCEVELLQVAKICVMLVNVLIFQFSPFLEMLKSDMLFSCGWVVSSTRIKQPGRVALSTLCYYMLGSSQKVK